MRAPSGTESSKTPFACLSTKSTDKPRARQSDPKLTWSLSAPPGRKSGRKIAILGAQFDIQSAAPNADVPGRHARNNLSISHISIHDGVGSDDGPPANADTLEDHGAGADPYLIPNLDL